MAQANVAETVSGDISDVRGALKQVSCRLTAALGISATLPTVFCLSRER
jgi:hypothetical protein